MLGVTEANTQDVPLPSWRELAFLLHACHCKDALHCFIKHWVFKGHTGLGFLWFPSMDPIHRPFTNLLEQHWQPYYLVHNLLLPPFRNMALVTTYA
jgi:hypothetical protein